MIYNETKALNVPYLGVLATARNTPRVFFYPWDFMAGHD